MTPLNKEMENKARVRIYLPSFQTPSPNNQNNQILLFHSPVSRCFFSSVISTYSSHPFTGILTNPTLDFGCSQHCFFIGTSGMCGQLTGEEITLGAVSQPPKALLHVFYHHQLSSPTAWHLCPHPQQGSSLGRAAWLYHDLTGLL